MNLDFLLLPLSLVGWVFTLVSLAALVLSLVLISALIRSGEHGRRLLTYSFVNDLALAAIWMLGLVGGVGVLSLQPWGRNLLEMFCWALIVLAPLSAATRLYALKQPDANAPPVNWLNAISGAMMVVLPIVVICAAAIVTLRGPEALKAFAGN